MESLVVSLFGSLIIAVVAAVVTVALTTRSFYSQKWWERKADVYSTILETLSDLVAQEDVKLNTLSKGWSVDKDTEALRAARSREAQFRLSQLENIGAFVASEDVAKHLTSIKKVQGDLEEGYLELLEDSPVYVMPPEASPADLAAADKSYEAHVYEAHLTKNRAALQKAIDTIRECGKRELQGRTWWNRVLCG